ncbi:6-phosphogluconolactonase [Lysobacter sp. F6437]|uniref:6-phosphogluconolactonase n=1 Tax=Lysobacter sp. F6437 TaxID=3459296 RepID=UPI00403DF605
MATHGANDDDVWGDALMAFVEHDYTDAEALAVSLAEQLRATCADAVAARGQAWLALGGGGTPLPLYRRLAASDLLWPQVMLVPTDERCVPHDHQACNLAAIGSAFDTAEGAQLLALTTPDGDPERSEARARATLAHHPAPFDAVVLGMGADAHTASLFPGVPGLAEALDPASAVDACRIDPQPLPPEAPYPRITLTAARLLRARALHLVIVGEAKRAVLRRAAASHDLLQHPIAAFLHAATAQLHVHWSP